ncbi:MAG: hypothetical protein ACKVVT_02100 [Dehalococcoidia bacterium]
MHKLIAAHLLVGLFASAAFGCGGGAEDSPAPAPVPTTADTSEPALTMEQSAERFCADLIAGNTAGVMATLTANAYRLAQPLDRYFAVFTHLNGEPHLEAAPGGPPDELLIVVPAAEGAQVVTTRWVMSGGRWRIGFVALGPYRSSTGGG